MIQVEHSLRRLRKRGGKEKWGRKEVEGKKRKVKELVPLPARNEGVAQRGGNRKREDGVKLKVQVGRVSLTAEDVAPYVAGTCQL